jgi:hypothetical protein
VDGARAGVDGGLQNGVGAQVARARFRSADVHGLIAGRHVARIGVRIRIHGNGADAHASGGGGDAAGNLSAIGNQQSVEHECHPGWCSS